MPYVGGELALTMPAPATAARGNTVGEGGTRGGTTAGLAVRQPATATVRLLSAFPVANPGAAAFRTATSLRMVPGVGPLLPLAFAMVVRIAAWNAR